MLENEIGKCLVNTAVEIHREIGPGLLESVYEVILANQLREQGIQVSRQVAVPIQYRELTLKKHSGLISLSTAGLLLKSSVLKNSTMPIKSNC